MKSFASGGPCHPDRHYMMDISPKVSQFVKMADEGQYFTIARPPLGGKTTILRAVAEALADRCDVLTIDLAALGKPAFDSPAAFCKAVADHFVRTYPHMPAMIREALGDIVIRDPAHVFMLELFIIFEQWISVAPWPLLLLIDNYDCAVGRQVFWDFAGMLQSSYVQKQKGAPAFQSVIMTGTADIRFAELIMDDEDRELNITPWTISAGEEEDPYFGEADVEEMIKAYVQEHTASNCMPGGISLGEVSQRIMEYTGGHPYLVSRLCAAVLQDRLPAEGIGTLIDHAARQLAREDNALFDKMDAVVSRHPAIIDALREGRDDADGMMQMAACGFVRYGGEGVCMAGRILEEHLITTLQ